MLWFYLFILFLSQRTPKVVHLFIFYENSFFSFYFVHNLLSQFSHIVLLCFIITAYPPCETVADCPKSWFRIYRCEDNFCRYREKIRRPARPHTVTKNKTKWIIECEFYGCQTQERTLMPCRRSSYIRKNLCNVTLARISTIAI